MSQTLSPIVGMHFRPPAKAILACVPQGAPLTLEREPSNEYDPNAIKVLVATDTIPAAVHSDLDLRASGYGFDLATILAQPLWHIGYINRNDAAALRNCTLGAAELVFAADGKPIARITLD